MKKNYGGPERREFVRLDYVTPLALKVCRKTTVSKLLSGYSSNISQSGLLCNIKEKVNIGDIVWISFDRPIISICEDLEKKVFVYQNGIIGKVVRKELKKEGNYFVGIQFITREEKNLGHIYPTVHFLKNEPGE